MAILGNTTRSNTNTTTRRNTRCDVQAIFAIGAILLFCLNWIYVSNIAAVGGPTSMEPFKRYMDEQHQQEHTTNIIGEQHQITNKSTRTETDATGTPDEKDTKDANVEEDPSVTNDDHRTRAYENQNGDVDVDGEEEETNTADNYVFRDPREVVSPLSSPSDRTLTAYLQASDPLVYKVVPVDHDNNKNKNNKTEQRQRQQQQQLEAVTFKHTKSCSKLQAQWPVDELPWPTDNNQWEKHWSESQFFINRDPYLPWIHDVFPTDDGAGIRFISQNKRRCHTGDDFVGLMERLEPQIALLQSVPIQRIVIDDQHENENGANNNQPANSAHPRYKLTDYDHADSDAKMTRFICRFSRDSDDEKSVSTWETMSKYLWNAEMKSAMTRSKRMYKNNGKENGQFWLASLVVRADS